MNCQQTDWVGFHFATLEAPARAALENHLLVCPACLRDYLRVKRSLEATLEGPAGVPSPQLKARLFAAVAAAFPPTAPTGDRVPVRWRLPRFASAAVAAGLILMIGWAFVYRTRPAERGDTPISELPVAADLNSVDSARQGVENVHFF